MNVHDTADYRDDYTGIVVDCGYCGGAVPVEHYIDYQQCPLCDQYYRDERTDGRVPVCTARSVRTTGVSESVRQ